MSRIGIQAVCFEAELGVILSPVLRPVMAAKFGPVVLMWSGRGILVVLSKERIVLIDAYIFLL